MAFTSVHLGAVSLPHTEAVPSNQLPVLTCPAAGIACALLSVHATSRHPAQQSHGTLPLQCSFACHLFIECCVFTVFIHVVTCDLRNHLGLSAWTKAKTAMLPAHTAGSASDREPDLCQTIASVCFLIQSFKTPVSLYCRVRTCIR